MQKSIKVYKKKKSKRYTTTYSVCCAMCQSTLKAHSYAADFGTLKCVKLCQCSKNQLKKSFILLNIFLIDLNNANPAIKQIAKM